MRGRMGGWMREGGRLLERRMTLQFAGQWGHSQHTVLFSIHLLWSPTAEVIHEMKKDLSSWSQQQTLHRTDKE